MSDYLPANRVRCLLKRKFAEIANEEVAPLLYHIYQYAVPVIRTKAQLIWWVDRFMDRRSASIEAWTNGKLGRIFGARLFTRV